MPRGISFLQISDVHFGAGSTGGRMGLPAALVEKRRQERRDAFAAAVQTILDRDLDGLLIPGDLFDEESIDTDTLRFVHHHLERLAPRPVFVAPGNHDPYGGASPYNLSAQDAARGLSWPENVIIFDHEEFRSVPWPGRPEVSVTGCGVAANVPSSTRRLAEPIRRGPAELHLLLFHGSRDDDHWLQADKATYPFSSAELMAQRFDWVALGHYHGHQILRAADGSPRAAYAGCLTAQRADEVGPKGGLVVTVSPAGAEVQPLVLDPRQVHRVEVDITGVGFAEAARQRIDDALSHAKCTPADIVLLNLTGRRSRGLDLGNLPSLKDQYFHLQVDSSRLSPDIELAAAAGPTTTEQRFIERLEPQLANDDDGTVRRALLYGLDALERGRLEVRYEELS